MEDRSARGGDQTSVRTAFASLVGAAPVGSAVSTAIAMACKSAGGAALETLSAKAGVGCAQGPLEGCCLWQGGSAAFVVFQGQRPAEHDAMHCALKTASAIMASAVIPPMDFSTLNLG
jgi:hypothetical protein